MQITIIMTVEVGFESLKLTITGFLGYRSSNYYCNPYCYWLTYSYLWNWFKLEWNNTILSLFYCYGYQSYCQVYGYFKLSENYFSYSKMWKGRKNSCIKFVIKQSVFTLHNGSHSVIYFSSKKLDASLRSTKNLFDYTIIFSFYCAFLL